MANVSRQPSAGRPRSSTGIVTSWRASWCASATYSISRVAKAMVRRSSRKPRVASLVLTCRQQQLRTRSHPTHGLIPWEFPRLCRGGSRSLTFPGVVSGHPSMKLRFVSRQSTRTMEFHRWTSSESLNHSKWECKYHVVFIPKCRRKTLYAQLRRYLGEVFRRLAEQKESRIEEGHLMPDHVHMMIRSRRNMPFPR